MTEFTSDNVIINSNREKVYDHLMDMANFEALFPEDKISDFTATDTGFSVKIVGQGKIKLERTSVVPNEKITLSALDDKPFKMDLNIMLKDTDEGKTDGHIYAEADLNPFIKMVAKKPLAHLFNSMTAKLATIIAAV
ncbi:MAG: SRPBCC family protein [Flavobacteriales bacterium]|nr:SRPBCC family protein [Flavobacteriales bacterium]